MPDSKHNVPDRFDFDAPRNTGVFICQRVRDGAPILHVSHDDDGAWQFMCGGDHGDAAGDPGSLACLECTVAGDPSLNAVADLPRGYSADRDHPDAAWARYDPHEDFIDEAVAQYGWAVQMIPGEGDEPPFAYTVGLFKSYGHPEIITLGLRLEVLKAMLNACGERVRRGEQLPVGTPFDGVLDDYPVALREVRAIDSYKRHVGYAGWFNQGWGFPLLQLVWPDKAGRFPGDRGAPASLTEQQPLLP
ncbi:MAG TPA: DUF4262 domain-containing protein [Anaeromyxobacteraceae bacterium]|nr:DUF4262 domain-containing protein [Anaeromyxobacteraceae bacterium]